MAIEIVDLPMKNVGSFHSYVIVYQRVIDIPMQLHLQPICFFCRKRDSGRVQEDGSLAMLNAVFWLENEKQPLAIHRFRMHKKHHE